MKDITDIYKSSNNKRIQIFFITINVVNVKKLFYVTYIKKMFIDFFVLVY